MLGGKRWHLAAAVDKIALGLGHAACHAAVGSVKIDRTAEGIKVRISEIFWKEAEIPLRDAMTREEEERDAIGKFVATLEPALESCLDVRQRGTVHPHQIGIGRLVVGVARFGEEQFDTT